MNCSEQPIELVFDHLVTPADDLFQLVAIKDLDVAANVTNRTSMMQSTANVNQGTRLGSFGGKVDRKVRR